MPSVYQRASLKSVLGLFLYTQGHGLPGHTRVKSASALSRFFNHYRWSTRQMICTTRTAILEQLATHLVRKDVSVRLLVDLSTLKKIGKFWQLSSPTFNIDGKFQLVGSIPATVRDCCGEETFSRETTERILVMLHGQ